MVCHKSMTHPQFYKANYFFPLSQFYKANYFFPLSAASGIGRFSDGLRISFIILSKPTIVACCEIR